MAPSVDGMVYPAWRVVRCRPMPACAWAAQPRTASSANDAISGNVASGVAVAGGVPRARAITPAVDPHRQQPELARGDVIVEQALGDVEDAVARTADPLERQLEVAVAGLVAPGLLGRDDPVERHAEPPVRRREQVVVAVGDDREAEPIRKRSQRRGRVRERRPLPDRPGKRRNLVVGRLEAEVAADAPTGAGQDVPVAEVRPRLDLDLVPAYAASSSSTGTSRPCDRAIAPRPAAMPASQSMSVP